tara:strand:- start:76 stop:1026 length:951 start_codon:yes stop_codon:yes gene_type:complete
MSKYFETKDGSLEAVSTTIAKEQPTIKKQEPNVKLERKTYFENKPGSIGDIANRVVSEGLIKEDTYAFDYNFELYMPSEKQRGDGDAIKEYEGTIKVSGKDAAEAKTKAEKELQRRIDAAEASTKGTLEGDNLGPAKAVSEDMDPVNKDAVKKKFDDRKDKDIDNDGDVDSSDKFLHKRRKAISKAVKNEELDKKDEPKVKEIVKKLKGASAAHAAQSKALDKAVKEAVKPDDKGEIINKKKHDAYGDPKKGETKPVDPEPKIKDIIKGEKETTRANGHMTKKKFSEMRIKLGKNGKTETGQPAPAVETEPKAERI